MSVSPLNSSQKTEEVPPQFDENSLPNNKSDETKVEDSYFKSTYRADAEYQGYFTCSDIATKGRLNNVKDLTKHILAYPFRPVKICICAIAAVIASIVTTILATILLVIVLKKNSSEKELKVWKQRSALSFAIAGIASIQTIYHLTCPIFKIFIIAALALGSAFPEIGKKARKVEKVYEEWFDQLGANAGVFVDKKYWSGEDEKKKEEAFGVLGLPSTATPTDIKKKYLNFAKTMHPDKNPSPEDAETFKLISAAVDELKRQNLYS